MENEKLALASKILKDAGSSEVYLFGSQAKGIATENSDVDLGVKGLPPTSFYRMYWELENSKKRYFEFYRNIFLNTKSNCRL